MLSIQERRTSNRRAALSVVASPAAPLRGLLRPNANGHGVAAEPEPAPKRRVLLSMRVCVRRVRKSRGVRRGALKAPLQNEKTAQPSREGEWGGQVAPPGRRGNAQRRQTARVRRRWASEQLAQRSSDFKYAITSAT